MVFVDENYELDLCYLRKFTLESIEFVFNSLPCRTPLKHT